MCDASPVFKAAFLGTFRESERQAMDLEEEDASVFEIITHWLYTKTCVLSEEVNPDDPPYLQRLATFKDWPHEDPSPESLADAGFLYEPVEYSPSEDNPLPADSSSGIDNVRCDCCDNDFDSWKPGDDPLQDHWQFYPDCLFAKEAHEALTPTKNTEKNGEAHFSEAYFMRLAEVYAVAEKYEITGLENSLINLVFRLKKASPRSKPPTFTVLNYVYDITPSNSPLRKLLVAWYTWHVDAMWYGTEDSFKTLYDIPEFAVELACSNGRRMGGLVKSSPLYGKSELYHEGIPT